MTPATRRNGYDVAVVGGGLVGCAVAYGLAGRGFSVAVLDEGDRAFRAARGNFGLVWTQTKGATFRPYARITRVSARSWPEFERELRERSGIDVDLRIGGITLCHGPEELAARAALMRHQFDADLPERGAYEMLDRQAVLGVLPEVGPDVSGASYCHLDRSINPLRLLRALLVAIQAQGAAYLPGHAVTSIRPEAGGFDLHGAFGRLHAERVVLAAGLGNAALAAMVGIDLPLSPLRGQMLITEKQPPWLTVTTHIARQMDEGGVLIGDSQEDVGYDDRTELGVIGNIAARAVRSFPRLARANVVRTWACLRIMTPDGFPVYEQSPAWPGAFAIAVHSGVTLCAFHADTLAEAIAAGTLGPPLAPFSRSRFEVQAPRQHAA